MANFEKNFEKTAREIRELRFGSGEPVPTGEPISGKLKEIGNRIAHLTYREIRALAAMVDPTGGVHERDEMVSMLLAASDEIAKRPTLPRVDGEA